MFLSWARGSRSRGKHGRILPAPLGNVQPDMPAGSKGGRQSWEAKRAYELLRPGAAVAIGRLGLQGGCCGVQQPRAELQRAAAGQR